MMLQLERSPGFSVSSLAGTWQCPCPVSVLHGGWAGDLCGALRLQGIPQGPWAEVAEENHDHSGPCVSAASPAGG